MHKENVFSSGQPYPKICIIEMIYTLKAKPYRTEQCRYRCWWFSVLWKAQFGLLKDGRSLVFPAEISFVL